MSTPTSRAQRLDDKRQRFEDAGRLPAKTVLIGAIVLVVALLAGIVVYQQFIKAPEVAGIPIAASGVTYPAGGAQMVGVEGSQTPDGISIPLADVKTNYIVGFGYARETSLPGSLQQVTGGNTLPMLAYLAPDGKVVVATALCEPCRSTVFHIDGDALVCNTCYTRWDLKTLVGIEGGCLAYPPEAVTAELRGDTVFVPKADLEAWTPRAF